MFTYFTVSEIRPGDACGQNGTTACAVGSECAIQPNRKMICSSYFICIFYSHKNSRWRNQGFTSLISAQVVSGGVGVDGGGGGGGYFLEGHESIIPACAF